ncbi:MAG: ATPase [Candidatus Firestonebacteria bacterium GWA2_43_8]|nr:MAG: ATPase [Candidatus Firestonebacteria bacterium GWA2_43_8]
MKDNSIDSKELIITRVFNFPRSLVWKAWSMPEMLKKWWGPKDYTCPVCKIDFRVGGKYLSCMRSPEGKDYWSTGIYRQIVPIKIIVMTDSFADEKGNVVPASYYGMQGEFPLELQVTVIFEDKGTKTVMTLQHLGLPGGKMTETTGDGWNQSFDKLEKVLIK